MTEPREGPKRRYTKSKEHGLTHEPQHSQILAPEPRDDLTHEKGVQDAQLNPE